MAVVLTLAAAVVVGITVGLLGGGGSILTVPILIYLAGMAPKPAIAASLFVVGLTSLAGLATHARAGRVRWRTGAVFGAAGMAGAYAGGRAAEYLPATVLLVAFGLMMAVTAGAMLRPRQRSHDQSDPAEPSATSRTPHLIVIVAEGFVVGGVTGLVGAGGGFVVVPALVVLGGLAMPQAVGTSLMVIAMQSFAGFAGHLHGVQVAWPLTIAVTTLAVAGALVGSRLTGRINAEVLRRAFGWLIVAMAGFVLAMQTPISLRDAVLRPTAGFTLLLLVTAATVGLVLLRRRSGSRV